jgi:beta-ureidopropionase / N-carbamoyl-L-amino-acid hydrolase
VTIAPEARRAAAAVNAERLWARHMAMAGIGRFGETGVNRQALSAEDIRARALLLEWAAARGWRPAVDPIANLFLRRPGTEPEEAPVLAGSHMDSQPRGGRFDGIFGVLAAFEVMEALDEAGIATRRPIELVAWTNEEGGRFAPGAMGSGVFAGAVRLEDCLGTVGRDGVVLRDALAQTLAATPDALRRPLGFPLHAYLEPHIEQGPQLEAAGVPIGVVTGIQGAQWYEVEVLGELAHAGTAPLASRRDAARAAVRMIAALQDAMHDPDDRVRFTVGRIDLEPNAPNTVAGRALFSIDLRHPESAELERRGALIQPLCERLAPPCQVRLRKTFDRPPCVFPAALVETVERAAKGLGLASLRLPSGAFHDASFIAATCPTTMLFVPCARGISHSPDEDARPEDLAAGTRVLAASLVELAG